jgi:hypothetical protein
MDRFKVKPKRNILDFRIVYHLHGKPIRFGVMYSGEYDYVCDVTLSVYPHRAGLKNMPGQWATVGFEPTTFAMQVYYQL